MFGINISIQDNDVNLESEKNLRLELSILIWKTALKNLANVK